VFDKYIYTNLFRVILFLNIALFFSCKKDPHITDYSILNLEENIRLKKIIFSGNYAIHVCGGNKGGNGAIYRSTDNGNSWNKTFSQNNCSINDIFFIDGNLAYACGDNLSLFKSTDGGNNWFRAWNYTFSEWQSYITPLQCILFLNKDTGFVSGGANYSKGVICKTYNGGIDWTFQSSDNEQKSMFFTNARTGYFSGYGIIQKTSDAGKTLNNLDVSGDYFTSLFFINNKTGFACGFNGGIYKTIDGGNTWSEVFKTVNVLRKRIHLNSIYFINDNCGFAAGEEGVFLKTKDSGNSWDQFIIDKTLNMYSISVNNHNEIYIACDGGKIVKLMIN
jgi:photosystem II stability/assembly factor-like uncharacterized protein